MRFLRKKHIDREGNEQNSGKNRDVFCPVFRLSQIAFCHISQASDRQNFEDNAGIPRPRKQKSCAHKRTCVPVEFEARHERKRTLDDEQAESSREIPMLFPECFWVWKDPRQRQQKNGNSRSKNAERAKMFTRFFLLMMNSCIPSSDHRRASMSSIMPGSMSCPWTS